MLKFNLVYLLITAWNPLKIHKYTKYQNILCIYLSKYCIFAILFNILFANNICTVIHNKSKINKLQFQWLFIKISDELIYLNKKSKFKMYIIILKTATCDYKDNRFPNSSQN